MKMIFDTGAIENMVKNLSDHGDTILTETGSAVKEADPSGIFECKSASQYQEALNLFEKSQKEMNDSLQALIKIVRDLSEAVQGNDESAASAILG